MMPCGNIGGLVRPSVRRSVHHGDRVENERFQYFLCMFECWGWVWVWMGVGCPCPPVRNDIVTPRHLFCFEFGGQGQGQGKRAWMQTLWGGCGFASTPIFYQMRLHPYPCLPKSRTSCEFAFASRIASLSLPGTGLAIMTSSLGYHYLRD